MMSSIETVRRSIRPWTSPYGETRYYVDDWFDLVGDILEDYTRHDWTADRLPKIKRGKVWFDSDARVHTDGIKDPMAVQIIISNLETRFFLR